MADDVLPYVPVILVHVEDPAGSGLAACCGRPIPDIYGEAYPNFARQMCPGCALMNHLTESGRLLPSGGEVSEEYSVVFEDGFRSKTFDERLAQLWFADPQAAIVRPIERRTVNTWPDGLVLLGPWSPVLSDSNEVPNA